MKKISTSLLAIATLLTSFASHAESTDLATQTGNDIGFTLSSYRYEEPNIMSSKGLKIGADFRTTKALQNETFVRGELRYAIGSVDYTGSGTASGEPDWYVEARGLFGADWDVTDAVMSTYTGFGYRYLFNDARGITSTGAWGYRRESNYFYLPIGIIHRRTLADQAKLVLTLEYDHLLTGKQISRLSDGGQGDSDAKNTQGSGYGFKLSAMHEKDSLAIGPYLHYWNIDKSNIVPWIQNGTQVFQNGFPMGIMEPKNNTIEFGLKASKQF